MTGNITMAGWLITAPTASAADAALCAARSSAVWWRSFRLAERGAGSGDRRGSRGDAQQGWRRSRSPFVASCELVPGQQTEASFDVIDAGAAVMDDDIRLSPEHRRAGVLQHRLFVMALMLPCRAR